jgi:hypothetical protein
MATGNRRYVLHGWFLLPNHGYSDPILRPVGSADVIMKPEGILDTERQEFYVEITLNQTNVHITRAVKGGQSPSWNEEVLLYV